MRKDIQSTCTASQTSKPKNLDLASGLGPSITITPMSELESDADSSPNIKDTRSRSCYTGNAASLGSGNIGTEELNSSQSSGMHYLSPFSIAVPTTCSSNNIRTTSDSNLSSSGYSSMASAGPSRSGSFNPICASESEDASSGTPTKVSGHVVGGSTCFPHPYQHHGYHRTTGRPPMHQSCAIHISETGW